ncbi:MAG: Holliday junction resolvase RuvX [Acidobacteriota bacterium]|nr:Holliday junction resolvase RuvX [Acidobacteriota bacterium]
MGFALALKTYRILVMMVRGASERVPAGSGVSAGRILAIDYGRKRIGLALSDELGLTARPLAVLSRTNRRDDLRRLREICHENAVSRIIVGHPLQMSGEAGEMAEEAGRFAARLGKEFGLVTELVDERLTSWDARQMAATQSNRRRNEPIDDLAAAILLREYLEKTQSRGQAAAQKA